MCHRQHVRPTVLPTRLDTTAKVNVDTVLTAACVMRKMVSVQQDVLLDTVEIDAMKHVMVLAHLTVAKIV